MTRRSLDELKQQIPLLKYLQAHDWQQARLIGFGRFLGLCPLHADHEPSPHISQTVSGESKTRLRVSFPPFSTGLLRPRFCIGDSDARIGC